MHHWVKGQQENTLKNWLATDLEDGHALFYITGASILADSAISHTFELNAVMLGGRADSNYTGIQSEGCMD